MGKGGSWFSAIKRVFTPKSKEKGTEEKSSKEKKKGLGKLRHGDKHSFIPLFREPSSIEKILGDAEEHHLINFKPLASAEQPKALPPASPRAVSAPRAAASPPRATASPPRVVVSPSTAATPPPRVAAAIPRAPLPPPAPPPVNAGTLPKPPFTPPAAPPVKAAALSKAVSIPPAAPPLRAATLTKALSTPPVKEDTPPRPASPIVVDHKRAEPTLRNQHACATKIQSVYRGHVAKRSYRALKGLVRLQNVMKGQSVKRQTISAMKSMQLLVHVQSQIQLRRMHMFENQALHRSGKDLDGTVGKGNMNQTDEWDDSVLTKEEVDARMQRKVEAIVKRERAIAYAYSNQLLKATPTASHGALLDGKTGGFPWRWNWLDRRLTSMPSPVPSESISTTKNTYLTPPRPAVDSSPLSRVSNYGGSSRGYNENLDAPSTPRSSRSMLSTRNRPTKTPPGRSFPQRFPRSRASGADSSFKDNDSLTSCPAFSIPRYMEPTTSARAKVRGSRPGTPTDDEPKRRISLPLARGIGSFKYWSKGSPFGSKESGTPRQFGKSPSVQSTGNLSVDSTVSMPAVIGRKPFNRFV
ncbi:IQ-domain [Dionaea muscipula]